MRSQGEIQRELCQLRFEVCVPFEQMQRDSGCSAEQLKSALRAQATELVLRRMDAYLDAKHLHRSTRPYTKLELKIKDMNREMWMQYKAHSMPMWNVMKLSIEQQKKLCIDMEWRLKKLLRVRIERETGKKAWFADSESYWRSKAKVLDAKILKPFVGHPDHRQRAAASPKP